MGNDEQDKLEGRLERAARLMREMPVPAGPPEAVIERAIALGEAGDTGHLGGAGEFRVVQERKGWWNMRVVRRSAIAAGIVLVVSASLIAMLLGRGATVAFADVVEQVRAAQAVRCKMVVEMDLPGGQGRQTSESEALMVAPGWTIVTTPSMKMIMSTEKGKMVSLMPAVKQAIVVELKNVPAAAGQVVNLLDAFKNVDGKAGKPLGERQVDGRATKGFEVNNGGMLMKVWADVKTELPVLVEMTPTSPMMPAGNYTMKDFDWKPSYDASELTVEIPAGYRIVTAQMDTSKASEQDVITMLRTMAEISGGRFPESVGLEGFSKASGERFAKRQVTETQGMTPEQKAEWQQAMTAEIMKLAAPIGRGWMFMGDVVQGSDWHYAGAGVAQGEKGRPVLWYKAPTGKWRVFDADLTVHDGTEKDLPQGTAVKLGMPASSAAPSTAPAK